MMTSNDIRDVKFSKAMAGYKQEEVDDFLNLVEEDYRNFENYMRTMQEKVDGMANAVAEAKKSENSLQNVLISAQQLADSIVAEANAKAETIVSNARAEAENATAEAKMMLTGFDEKLALKRAEAEKEMTALIEEAQRKQKAVEAATADTVVRQQALFDKLRLEVAAFKNELTEQYKRHIEIISKLPDCVAMDAERAAKAVSIAVDEAPDMQKFVPVAEVQAGAPVTETEQTAEGEVTGEISSVSDGFVVATPETEQQSVFDNEPDGDDDISFNNKFFSRKK